MAKVRRYFRVMPPGAFQVEMTEVASELPLHELEQALAIIQAEMDHRTGKQKYRIPASAMLYMN